MSWQSYVDDHLVATGTVSKAALVGLDGSIWAASAGFGLTTAETKKFISNWASMQATGINVAGVKYMFLRGPPMEEKKVLGKKGDSGVIIVKTTQAFIVSVYEAPIISEQCGPTTEKLADYLVSVGY